MQIHTNVPWQAIPHKVFLTLPSSVLVISPRALDCSEDNHFIHEWTDA